MSGGIFQNLDLSEANKMQDKRVFLRFTPGTHVCSIEKTGSHLIFRTKSPLFVADLKLISSSDPKLEIGTTLSYSDSPLQTWSLQRIRQLLIAGAGLQPGQPDDDEIIKSTDWAKAIRDAANNPSMLAGATIAVTGFTAKTKAGEDYTRLSFATTPENRSKRIKLTTPATK
jgi:hypothetical protein